LEALPEAKVPGHSEFIETQKLMSPGIGYVDTRLPESSPLSNTPPVAGSAEDKVNSHANNDGSYPGYDNVHYRLSVVW